MIVKDALLAVFLVPRVRRDRAVRRTPLTSAA